MKEKISFNQEVEETEESEDFLEKEKKSVIEKIKDALNIIRPHGLEEAMYKAVGSLTIYAGAKIGIPAFFHPEQLNISGNEFDPSALGATKMIAVLCAVVGTGMIFEGFRQAVENIKIKKELDNEKLN